VIIYIHMEKPDQFPDLLISKPRSAFILS
jgi:hypothetical protein